MLLEHTIDNYMYMLQIQEIVNNPQLLKEGISDDLKNWGKGKFQSFSSIMMKAAQNNDLQTIKKYGKAIPKMGMNDIDDLGKKVSSKYRTLKSTAAAGLKKKANNKINPKQLELMSTVYALKAIGSVSPEKQLKASVEQTEEYDEITGGDIARWVTSAVLGVATTFAIVYFTGVLFIFGPLLFFAMWNAILLIIFGGQE